MFAHAFLIMVTITTITCHVIGILCAVQAVMISRTPQAAIGWGFSLVIFPYLAIPLFLIFGESRFPGYTLAGKRKNLGLDDILERTQRATAPFRSAFPKKYLDAQLLTERIRGLPVTEGNRCELLVDGRAAFDAIFATIDQAEKYVIVQFFIVHDDGLGRELKQHLVAASQRGVKCWLLFDKIGSKKLPKAYIEELKESGISVAAFRTNRQIGWNFQINFRNHRKLALVDGKIAFFGGLNAGDEYLGL
ncbi:MAG: phospholipase D-like domain-containing protein, partial [Saprospiraceae bacterium]